MEAEADPALTPPWPREAVHAPLEEARSFLRTWADFAFAPRRFSAEWASGRRAAMNPFAFFATAVALVTASYAGLDRLWPLQQRAAQTLGRELFETLVPYLYWVVVAALAHGVLRLGGSRAPVRTTLGLCFYVGGAWNILGLVALAGASRLVPLLGETAGRYLLLGISTAQTLVDVIWFGLGLRSAHRKSPWLVSGALAIALFVTGAVVSLLAKRLYA